MTNPIERAYRKFCNQRFPLPTEQQVADLERRIGLALPPDYCEYLLKFNGGYFDDPEFALSDAVDTYDYLASMHGIGVPLPCYEFASDAVLALFDENDPPEIMAIGSTPMGNLLLLVTHPDGRGNII